MSDFISTKKVKIKECKRAVICDYCGYIKVKPDQRESQMISWAKLKIKNSFQGDNGRPEIVYFRTDICPDCIAKKQLIEGAGAI